MQLTKVAQILLLAIAVTAEKKIELQDIEEDNLKSEKQYVEKPKRTESSGVEIAPESLSLEFLKNADFTRYLESPVQQQRYVQQYAVTEPPERSPSVALTTQEYSPQEAHQSMVGYLSNIPMQIFFVPQLYNEQAELPNTQTRVQYVAPAHTRVSAYDAPEDVQQHTNYVEIPAYVTPSGKTYLQHPPSSAGYVHYAASSTVSPTTVSIAPMGRYQIPVSAHYATALAAPPLLHKGYYHSHIKYTDSNRLEDGQESEVENPKQFATQTEATYPRQSSPEFPRYYTSRAPIREEQNHGPVPVLPHPNPLLLHSLPSHLSHIPKALPVYRPLTKPVYASGGGLITNAISPRPIDAYGLPYKKRPTSLLDSYIPSSVQLEYMKRGYARDPLSAYDVLSANRHIHPAPRHYERGFLPNQLYHTAAGCVTYGHYKRTPKLDLAPK